MTFKMTVVSIRARHCCRAMPMVTLDRAMDMLVSIRARHCCRAMLRYRMHFIRKRKMVVARELAGQASR